MQYLYILKGSIYPDKAKWQFSQFSNFADIAVLLCTVELSFDHCLHVC